MKLSFATTYLSIREFPTIDLPDLVFITGLNGSGKSHLLQAISQNKIACDSLNGTSGEVRLFTAAEMSPQDSGGFWAQQIAQERFELFNQYKQHRQNNCESILQFGRNYGATGLHLNSVNEVIDFFSSEKFRAGRTQEDQLAILKQLQATMANLGDKILMHLQRHNPDWPAEVTSIAANHNKSVATLVDGDFSASNSPSWGKTAAFQQQFGRLFVQYRELVKENKLRHAYGHPSLLDEEFKEKYKMPPWDFVNESLAEAGLGFRINAPDEVSSGLFTPILTKIDSQAEVQFGALSSGERVIMSFALCLYYANEGRQITSYPKVLLLDEVDAPLHPSMCKHFINTISEVLVKKHGVKVIVTTHSPTTIALAPEDSIYVMKAGEPGLHSTSKADALNILTAGVPTIAINYAGRRQVFVESPRDAEMHGLLFQILRDNRHITSERSLEFLSTGSTNQDSKTDQNTGCDNVRRIVKALTNTGNHSVFGFIDWDLCNEDVGRTLVLFRGERYSLENLAFDPLAIIGLLAKDPRGLEHPPIADLLHTFGDFIRTDHSTLQRQVDEIVSCILPESDHSQTTAVRYVGGVTLNISSVYLRTNGHELQDRVLQVFPGFKKYLKNLPITDMAREIFREVPAIIPAGVLDSYNRILDQNSH